VALVDLPGLLADVVRDAFAEEPDIDVEVLPAGSPAAAILTGHPDVVMVASDDPASYPFAAELLRERPALGLFAVSLDGRQAWSYEICVCSRPLAEVSGSSLREAVRVIANRVRR
jgi:hypothetical protein